MPAPGLTAVADPSLIHVLRRLELIEARVRAAVARRRATDPETDDRFRGLYISQVHVDRLLAEKSVPTAPDAAAAKARDEIEAGAAVLKPGEPVNKPGVAPDQEELVRSGKEKQPGRILRIRGVNRS